MRLLRHAPVGIRNKIIKAFERKDYRTATRLARLASELAGHSGDPGERIESLWVEGALAMLQGRQEESYATYSRLLAIVEREQTGWDASDRELARTVARTYGDWAKVAATLSAGAPEQLAVVFDRAEGFILRYSLPEMLAEIRHAASIVYGCLGDSANALVAAEEALHLRRQDPFGPGCGLDHHLTIYAETLADVGRFDDALCALDEAANQRGGRQVAAQRGHLLWRQGRLKEALTAYEEMSAFGSDHYQPCHRGLVRALLGDRDLAWADLSEACTQDRRSAVSAVWLFSVTGDDSAIHRRYEKDGWVEHLLAAARGRTSLTQLLQKATEAHTDQRRRERRSQALCFMALWAERRGDTDNARRHYTAVQELGCIRETAYWWACWRDGQSK